MSSREKERNIAMYLGKLVRIICMDGESAYNGRMGKVTYVDDIGQLHGTWGGCALIPGLDDFAIIG